MNQHQQRPDFDANHWKEYDLEKILDLKEEEEARFVELGTALYHEGRVEAALNIFSGLTALRPERSDYWTALGAVLVRLERYDEARPVLKLACRMNPEDIAAWIGLGECELGLGSVEAAAEAFESALELDPEGQTEAGRRARALVHGLSRFFEGLLRESERAEA